jgi:predicted phage terminase large subunit-like protein
MNDFNTTATFPGGGKIRFAHLQYEKDKFAWHGSQLLFIAFDELQTFTFSQFLYVLTRNRPSAGCNLRPYWRATCNPDADSWLREFLDWWIDSETGYPIPERDGVVRYYTVVENRIVWVDKDWRDPRGNAPKSFTFIHGTLADNQILREQDPTYEATLYAQDYVTRERLLGGNWNISYRGGMFNPGWFKKIDRREVPDGIRLIRYWDLAATPEDEEGVKDPANTAGVLMGIAKGDVYILDCEAFQEAPGEAEKKMGEIAETDGAKVIVGWEEEKGGSGKYVSNHLKKDIFKGYETHADPVSGKKEERARPLASLAEHGHVYIVKGEWNRAYLAEMGSFPLGKKDRVDATTGGLKLLGGLNHVWPSFDLDSSSPRSCICDFNISWTKMGERPTLHYGAFYEHKDLSLWFLAGLWDDVKGVLFVYDGWGTTDPTPTMIANTLAFRMHLREVECEKLVGNEEMFAKRPAKGTARIINTALSERDVEPRILKPSYHDLEGAILEVNRLLDQGRIFVHEKLKEPARQFANWTIQKGKPDKEDCGYCRALCLLISELSQQQVYRKAVKRPDYKRIPEKKFSRGQEAPPEEPKHRFVETSETSYRHMRF